MSVDPDLRIALGFILLLRVGIGILYSGMLANIGIFAELRRVAGKKPWRELLFLAFLTIPLIPFVIEADGLAWILLEVNSTVAEYSIMRLPHLFRCLLLVPAVAGLLLAIWSRHCAVRPREVGADEPSGNRFITGPFRFVRFPQVLADLLIFGPLLVATDNWGAVLSFFAACILMRGVYVPHADQAWRQLLGDGYGEYAGRTGAVLPRMPESQPGMAADYCVPKRFGLSAIIALVTMFAVIFGCINLLQSRITEFQLSPTLHLFFGVELLAIWIGQMRFGKSPRGVSTIVGAILMPIFIFFSIDHQQSNLRAVALIPSFFFGGLIGYCLGTLAAGLFLVMDWLGPILPGSRGSRLSQEKGSAAAAVSSPWTKDEFLSPRDERNLNDQ